MIIIFTAEDLNEAGREILRGGQLAELDPKRHVSGDASAWLTNTARTVVFVAPDKRFVVQRADDRPDLQKLVGHTVPWGLFAYRLGKLVDEARQQPF